MVGSVFRKEIFLQRLEPSYMNVNEKHDPRGSRLGLFELDIFVPSVNERFYIVKIRKM